MKMNRSITKVAIAAIAVVVVAVPLLASPMSKMVVLGGKKAAAQLGLRAAGGRVIRGGAKLAAVASERAAAKQSAGMVAGGMTKYVTAKQLLAAGGGAAMVVAAHECADGVQQMGEGVRTAVEANPDLAVNVANCVTAPVRYLAVVGGVSVLLFLVWFAWPWISLVRNWSRLAAARRNAAMMDAALASDGSDRGNAIAMPVVDALASVRPGFTRVELIMLASGFLVLTIFGVCRMVGGCSVSSGGNETEMRTVSKVDLKAMTAKRAEAVARMKADYVAAIDKHYSDFVAEAESVASAEFGAVRDNIPAVVEKFSAFSRCKDLIVTLAKDKMDNGVRTNVSLKRDLEADFYRGLYGARDKVNECFVKFLRNADAERESFRHELEAELDLIKLPGDEDLQEMMIECGERIEKSKQELSEGQLEAAIGAAIEGASIRITVSTVARIMGKSAARLAGSAAVGTGAAVADGPLPIGDIIGGVIVLGSTCWTAYDIWQATKVLPREFDRTLRAVTDDCQEKIVSAFKMAGAEVYEAYLNVHN